MNECAEQHKVRPKLRVQHVYEAGRWRERRVFYPGRSVLVSEIEQLSNQEGD